MTWIVEPCPPGWGFDAAGSDASPGNVLTSSLLDTMMADPRPEWRPRHVCRYTRLDGTVRERTQPGGDWGGVWSLSLEELDAIAQARYPHAADGSESGPRGLHLRLVQFGPSRGDRLTADLGARRGVAAVCAREALGLPAGAHLWCDLEGARARESGAMACYQYVDAWSRAVVRSGDKAGLYIGDDNVPLAGPTLYRLPYVSSYWGATFTWYAWGARMSPEPRGWAIRQRAPSILHGLSVDWDEVRPDGRGETPMGYRWVP